LAARKTVSDPISTGKEDEFRREIFKKFSDLVDINALLTFEMIDF